VISKEPSQQVTPLSNEPTGFPEQVVRDHLLSPPIAETRRWREVLNAFLVWVASVLFLLFVPVVVALPYLAYNWINYGPPRPEDLAGDKTLIFLSIIGILPTHLLTLGVVWLYVTDIGRLPFFKTPGFKWPKNFSPLLTTALGILMAFVLLAIGWAVTQVLGGSKTQLELLVESSLPARFATAFVAVCTAPLVEELVYRGVLYSALERAAGVGVAIACVSLLFAGVHVFQYSNNIGVITVITLLSFTLTFARAYSGSVLPPFIIHLVFNGIQSLVLVLSPFIDSKLLEKGEQVTPTTPGLEMAGQLLGYLCRMT
jgi:membrane protease YdiL (CAAX protease family)